MSIEIKASLKLTLLYVHQYIHQYCQPAITMSYLYFMSCRLPLVSCFLFFTR